MPRRRHPRDRVGVWWNPASPDDVRAEQERVRAARAGVNTSLKSKPPSGDPAEIDAAVRAWNALDTEVALYLNEEPSAFWWSRDEQVTKGKGHEAQIESWRAKFGTLGVAVPAPPAPATAPAGSTANDPLGLGNVAETVKWLAIAFLAYKLLGK
jgi:hypothetical protein